MKGKYIWWWFKDLFRRYHSMTKEQIIDGNRKYWDDNYRQWREVKPYDKPSVKSQDDMCFNPYHKPKDDRMTLFPPGQMPPEIND